MSAATMRDVVAELAACTSHDAAGRLLDAVEGFDGEAFAARLARTASRPTGDLRPALATAVGVLDLTSLRATDTSASVTALCERALAPDPDDATVPPTAAVCVPPDLVGVAAARLAGSGVRAACVAGGFPSARTFPGVKRAEIHRAVAAGADEIDVVLDRAAFGEERYADVLDDVRTARAECDAAGRSVHLKIILEVAELADVRAVRRAAWLVLAAGADVVKTSTGTLAGGATPASVLALCEVVAAFEAATGRAAGVKAAGGVRATADALWILGVAESVGGRSWLVPGRLRIGASALLDDLLAQLHLLGARA